MINTPSAMTTPPKIRLILIAFCSLCLRIMPSVGKGSKISIKPSTKQEPDAIGMPTAVVNEAINSPIGMPKTQMVLITKNNFE